jgi:hypothetical protein
MTELLEGGPPQRQRRWPTVLVALTVAGVLGVGAVQKLSAGGSTSTARPSPTAAGAHPSYVRPSFGPPSLPAPTVPPEVVLPASPTPATTVHPRLVGVPLREASEVSLVIGGSQLIGVGSRSVGFGTVPVRTGERVIAVRSLRAGLMVTVTTGDGQDQPYSRVYLVRKGAPARLLASTDAAFPAFDGQSLFTIGYSGTGTSPNLVTRIDLSGRVLSRHKVPPESVLAGDTVKGLLVQRMGTAVNPLSTLQLLDRTTFAVTRTIGKIGWVVANTGTRAAWTNSTCDLTCTIVVADLASGRRTTLKAERGFGISVAALSPDGKRVALAYSGRHPEQPGGGAAGFVDVVELATGARHRVPGVATDVKQAADLSWTPDGRWLAISVDITDKGYRVVGLWPASGGAVQIVRSKVPGSGYTEGALLAL